MGTCNNLQEGFKANERLSGTLIGCCLAGF